MPSEIRMGCKDMWNSYMVEDASWSKHDIPYCPTTALSVPRGLVSFAEARELHNKSKKNGVADFHIDVFLHFYLDDQKFVGERKGIWAHPEEALKLARICDGLITPDFSTYADFPDPIKRDATYKMRVFGLYAAKQGIPVINNVRWGTSETWEYCFDGVPQRSIVSVGTVASDIRKIDNRPLFEGGLLAMVEALNPKTILIYGSANNIQLTVLRNSGIEVVEFQSQTNMAYKDGGRHE